MQCNFFSSFYSSCCGSYELAADNISTLPNRIDNNNEGLRVLCALSLSLLPNRMWRLPHTESMERQRAATTTTTRRTTGTHFISFFIVFAFQQTPKYGPQESIFLLARIFPGLAAVSIRNSLSYKYSFAR